MTWDYCSIDRRLWEIAVQEFRLQEKTRVYALARELNVESKDLLDLCRQAGFDVKNQLSSLDPDQRDAVLVMLKKGGTSPAPAASSAAPPKAAPSPVIPVVQTPVRNLNPARPKPAAAQKPAEKPAAPPAPVEVPPAAPVVPPPSGEKPIAAQLMETPPAAKPAEPTAPRPPEPPPAGQPPVSPLPAAAARPGPVSAEPPKCGTWTQRPGRKGAGVVAGAFRAPAIVDLHRPTCI